MADILLDQIQRIASKGPLRGKDGRVGDLTISSQEDGEFVLEKLESQELCIDKITCLTLENFSLVDHQIVGVVKIIRWGFVPIDI